MRDSDLIPLSTNVTALFVDVARIGGRRTAARALAAAFGAEDLIFFVRDAELDAWLPAQGFPQTLPAVRDLWSLIQSSNGIVVRGKIQVTSGEGVDAQAVAFENIAVIVWPAVELHLPPDFKSHMELLEMVFQPEVVRKVMEAQLANASAAATDVQSLALQLDNARKLLEQRIHERTAELRASIRELEGFTYSIAHDLRAPLRAIIASCKVMEEDFGCQLPAKAVPLLRRQADRALKLGNLIDDLLRLSRLSRGELERSDINVSELAQEVGAEVLSRYSGTSFNLVITPGLTAYADSRLTHLLLQNLIENAVKFSPDGGVIQIGKESDAMYVSDQGIGFDPTYSEKIFRPFERLVKDHEIEGTGIGLANVQRIVDRHGGRVWAKSRPGDGATFFFTLTPPPSTT